MGEGNERKPTRGRIQAVLGGGHRTGRWYAADITKVMAVCGRTVIDLRHAENAGESLVFNCLSAFGSVVFVVAEGTDVRTSGLAVLASQRSEIPAGPTDHDTPRVEIEATTILGRLHVVTEIPESRADRRARRKAQRRSGNVESQHAEPTPPHPGATAVDGRRSPSAHAGTPASAAVMAEAAARSPRRTEGTAHSALHATSGAEHVAAANEPADVHDLFDPDAVFEGSAGFDPDAGFDGSTFDDSPGFEPDEVVGDAVVDMVDASARPSSLAEALPDVDDIDARDIGETATPAGDAGLDTAEFLDGV